MFIPGIQRPFEVQLFSEKCTGRYFKVRDDDLSSKQGSICSFKMKLIKIIGKYLKGFIYINLYFIQN